MDLFPSSGDGKETSTLLGSLESAYLNLWMTDCVEETLFAGEQATGKKEKWEIRWASYSA
jgi:hypothetical protein